VNQWTLLVGALPIAYIVAGGALSGLPLDERQTEELLLTSAQSLLATLLICDLDFSRTEAVLLGHLRRTAVLPGHRGPLRVLVPLSGDLCRAAVVLA
jgi:hypothetical protein